MTEAMPFLQKYDITFLRPPTITASGVFLPRGNDCPAAFAAGAWQRCSTAAFFAGTDRCCAVRSARPA